MDVIKSDVQEITSLNTSVKLKDQLNDGIQYFFSVVDKLQKDSPGVKYEIHGKLVNTTQYEISIRDESVIRNNPVKGQRVVKGIIYLSMYIYYGLSA